MDSSDVYNDDLKDEKNNEENGVRPSPSWKRRYWSQSYASRGTSTSIKRRSASETAELAINQSLTLADKEDSNDTSVDHKSTDQSQISNFESDSMTAADVGTKSVSQSVDGSRSLSSDIRRELNFFAGQLYVKSRKDYKKLSMDLGLRLNPLPRERLVRFDQRRSWQARGGLDWIRNLRAGRRMHWGSFKTF